MSMSILFNKRTVLVNFNGGTDHRLLPALINALRYNRLTMINLIQSIDRVDLFASEAIIYSIDGNKARVPIF
ncbi:hypothetical protein [Paenibacillus aestuarii]|uniref:Uncharacterized protein n=1 Tax=Paenibacillus aestuarii TaxID=516965 RepID=A0ABW0KIR3_9BACL|nr:hypothetical protein [Paenibacillus aestuarii]